MRYSQILLLLPTLLSVNSKMMEKLFCRHIIGQADMEVLLKEMLQKLWFGQIWNVDLHYFINWWLNENATGQSIDSLTVMRKVCYKISKYEIANIWRWLSQKQLFKDTHKKSRKCITCSHITEINILFKRLCRGLVMALDKGVPVRNYFFPISANPNSTYMLSPFCT